MHAPIGPEHRFVITRWGFPEMIRFADTWTHLISELREEYIYNIMKIEVVDKKTSGKKTSRRRSS